MQQKPRILVIDDEKDHADAAGEALRRVGYDVETVYTSDDALRLIQGNSWDVVVTDLQMDGVSGIEILKTVRAASPATEVILLTGYGTVESAVEAMKLGARTYLEKGGGLNLAELRETVRQAVESARKLASPPGDEPMLLEGVIGSSAQMRRIARLVKSVAPTTATVLIVGESGTGKELIAQSLHKNSPRSARPFVALNCAALSDAALSEGILESELFGHEKGSFTGATSARKGRFEYADGGTLFLDEVGDMPLSTQVKLLRVLEYGEIFRVGSNEPVKVDVRLVAATNRELEREVAEGRFREDLYFRLKVVTLYLPALRDHREDIDLLVDAFMREFSGLHKKHITGISIEAREALKRYRWPGNVRELRNCIESMVVVSSGGLLDVGDLPDHIQRGMQLALAAPKEEGSETALLDGMTLKDAERELIRGALERTDGNREEAARILGIGERTLYRKINEYGLR
ncbi:MAG: sigma-54-dependent transcriptional regulator [Planctomycetota bacterium]|jgi:two-component system response regulator HydG